MTLYALKFVSFAKIEDHFRIGWLMSFPNAPMHHHHYGCELAWICGCPVPGGFETELVFDLPQSEFHRVPEIAGAREAQ